MNSKKPKKRKFRREYPDFMTLPKLPRKVREELKDHYREGVMNLQSEFGLDVESLVAAPRP